MGNWVVLRPVAVPASAQSEEDNFFSLFHTNCWSAKAKSCKLSASSTGYYIACLTDTHVDCSTNSRTIIDRDDLLFFKNDRNLYGGEVLVAINQNLQPERIDIQPGDEELVLVKLNNSIVIVCYYRPSHGNSISGFVDVRRQVKFRDILSRRVD